jgi:protein-export membrane protein SecD
MFRYARWYIGLIVLASVVAVALMIANFLPKAWTDRVPFPVPRYVLGLDLQGGSQLLLQVDTAALRRDRLTEKRDEVRRAVLEQPRINIAGAIQQQGDLVIVRVRDEAQFALARTRFQQLAQPLGTALALGTTVREVDVTEPEPGLFQFRLNEAGVNERVRAAVDQSIEIIRRRVDQLGTTEPSISRQGRDRILVQVPGLQNPEQLKRILGQTAKLTFRLVDQSMTPEQAQATRPPPDSELLASREGGQILVYRQVMVAGEDLRDAQPGFDQRTNEPIVTFRFNTSGARRFAAVTQENVGRPFAIVLDQQVISAPVIREPILGGSGQISGSFTPQSANELAVLLRAGALPAPLTVIEERVVGPGLGQDSIDAGTMATVVAAVFVILFMFAVYGTFGLIANIALLVHVGMIFALLAALGATLTLPGIAGIVLTIGTAVDSNVLIYERMREEAKQGRSLISAVEAGFTRAFATIVDSNSTMAIAAVILFFMGTGPVKGFAVVFLLGIATTVITAVTMTRMMIALWYRLARPTRLPF